MKTHLRKNSFKLWVAVLSVLVVFACALTFTGSWFTDSAVLKGNLDEPELDVYIVQQSGSTYTQIEPNTLEWSSSEDSKNIYLQFPADKNNVKYVLVRFALSITWGTKVNGKFVADSTLPTSEDGSIALTPTIANSSSWTRGEPSSMATLSYIAENSGYTVDQLQSLGLSATDLAQSFGVDTSNIPTFYYYNDIVVLANQTSPLQIISGFTFSGDSKYAGKVARINIMAETASVSDTTLGGTENGTPYEGTWTSTANDAHRATNAWVMSIKSKRKTLLGF